MPSTPVSYTHLVVDVDETSQTAALQFVTGDGPVLPGVSWADLRYMDEEEGGKSAAAGDDQD